MLAENLTFGIEIETTIPANSLRVGPHGAGYVIPGLPGWLADRDPSISAGRGREACEFVSPVYRGTEGLLKLIADVNAIKAMGAKVNASCGLHIHVGFDRTDAAATTKLVTLVSNFEKAIYASTGTKSRENGRWCRGLNRYGNATTAAQTAAHHRYHVLNLATGNKPTVEFRAFAGSLNVEKITGYVRMCVGMVERALTAKRTTNWTAKPVVATSPIHRSGEGQTALTRLFYQLGWTRGRAKHCYGDLNAPGVPSLRNVKRTLMSLARKYDAQP